MREHIANTTEERIFPDSTPYLLRLLSQEITSSSPITEAVTASALASDPSVSSAMDGVTQTASNAGLEETEELGGIDLSTIDLTLKDEKFVSSLNPADQQILLAAKYFKDGWESLTLLYIHQIMLLLKDNLIKDIQNRDLLFGILNQLKLKDFLDPQALNFLNFLHSQRPISEIKLTFLD